MATRNSQDLTLDAFYTGHYLPWLSRKRKPRTVAEYVRLWETRIRPRFGGVSLSALRRHDIEDWHAHITGRVLANRALAVLSSMCARAVSRETLSANPCAKIERHPEKAKERFLSPGEASRLLAALSAWDDLRAPFFRLLLLTGARPSELLHATVAERSGAALKLTDSKTGARTIFLSAPACAVLDGLTPRADGRYFPDFDVRRGWEYLKREAGIPDDVRPYDLRHTFASNALATGASLSVVGLMLGHRKAQTTLRYAHLLPEVGIEAAQAVAARLGATEGLQAGVMAHTSHP